MAVDPAYKFERFDELYDILTIKEGLIKECGNQNEWADLLNFIPPQIVQSRIKQLGKGWKLQDLINGAGITLNMDYFPIKITSMPFKGDGTPAKWQPEELFEYIRKNINEFVDVSKSKFEPYSEYDKNLWQSNNPLTSVISINIPFDDGSVICSQYSGCCWVFSTLSAPQWPYSEDGTHPVCGNRQFGYNTNNNETTIFTRGVDRFYQPISLNWFYPPDPQDLWLNDPTKLLTYLVEKVAFEGADDLWKSLQAGIRTWVILRGGQAEIIAPETNRPIVGNIIKQLLKESQKITALPCN